MMIHGGDLHSHLKTEVLEVAEGPVQWKDEDEVASSVSHNIAPIDSEHRNTGLILLCFRYQPYRL